MMQSHTAHNYYYSGATIHHGSAISFSVRLFPDGVKPPQSLNKTFYSSQLAHSSQQQNTWTEN